MGKVNERSRNAVLVLAGGRGRRMGGEKLTLALDSELILARVLRRVSGFAGEILLSVAPDQVRYVSGVLSGIISQYGIRTVVDAAQPLLQPTSRPDGDEPRSGPLVGIVSGLEAASTAWVFVCACDMPFVSEAVVRALWKGGDKRASAIVPFVDGYYEPLHAFYNKSCLPEARSLLAAGRRKTAALFEAVRTSLVDESHFSHLPGFRRSFENINSKSDLERMAESL